MPFLKKKHTQDEPFRLELQAPSKNTRLFIVSIAFFSFFLVFSLFMQFRLSCIVIFC